MATDGGVCYQGIPYKGLILNERVTKRNPVEYLGELPEWNRCIAEQLALEESITRTDEHWEVLHFLHRRFSTHD